MERTNWCLYWTTDGILLTDMNPRIVLSFLLSSLNIGEREREREEMMLQGTIMG